MGSQLSSEVLGAFRHTQVFGEITTLTFERFLAKVDELNDICQYLVDTKNRRLIFEVHSSSDTPVLWKSEVRVSCKRVPVGSAEEEASRFLTLRQFLHTYHTIKAYYTAAVAACGASPAASDMGASALFSGVLGSSGSGAELEECCICMEHRPEVTLPCTHSYCLRCIEQWPSCCRNSCRCYPALAATSPLMREFAKSPAGISMKASFDRHRLFQLLTGSSPGNPRPLSARLLYYKATHPSRTTWGTAPLRAWSRECPSFCCRNVSNTTCPLCREEFASTRETWVMSEAPESSEVLSEMQRALAQFPKQGPD